MAKVMTLTELWRSPEWKARSRAYTEGKACEWCRGRAGDKYIDSKGKERTLGLAPHHIEKHKWGLALYNQVRDRLYRQWLKGNAPGDAPRGLSKRERSSYLKHQWTRQNLEAITVAFEEEKRLILDAYMRLDPKKNIILCNRCHYAREKGLLICPVCKTRYRKPRNPTCSLCR